MMSQPLEDKKFYGHLIDSQLIICNLSSFLFLCVNHQLLQLEVPLMS